MLLFAEGQDLSNDVFAVVLWQSLIFILLQANVHLLSESHDNKICITH